MQSQDEYNQVLSYAMQAMALMLKNKTPATPENYAKWYKHAAELFSAETSEEEEFDGWDESELIQPEDKNVSAINSKPVPEKPDDQLSPSEAFQVSKVKDLVEKTTDSTNAFKGSMNDIAQKLEAMKQARADRNPKPKKKAPQPKPAFAAKGGKFVPFKG